MKEQKQKIDHYQEVTDRIIEALQQGTKPWEKPWESGIAAPSGPVNAVSGRRDRGINTLLLGMHPKAFETGDPRWCTFKQASEKGWQVRKGEKAARVFFFKPIEIEDKTAPPDADDTTKTVPVLRSYAVFHASQIEGIPAHIPPTFDEAPWRKPDAVYHLFGQSGADVRIGGDRAYYSPGTDHIQLPPEQAFKSGEGWAATALHELGHWTGHPKRLNRDLRNRFGSQAYAQEELRAELASAFMCAELGIQGTLPGHASYIDNWLDVLKQDKREIFRAASDAQKAADYCLAFHPAYKATMDADHQAPVPTGTLKPAAAALPDHVKGKITAARIRQRQEQRAEKSRGVV